MINSTHGVPEAALDLGPPAPLAIRPPSHGADCAANGSRREGRLPRSTLMDYHSPQDLGLKIKTVPPEEAEHTAFRVDLALARGWARGGAAACRSPAQTMTEQNSCSQPGHTDRT